MVVIRQLKIMIMKRLIVTILIMAVLLPARADTIMPDYITLDRLVAGHITQSNRLKERVAEVTLSVVQSEDECAKSDKYTEMAHKVRDRMGTVLSYLTFANDMLKVLRLMKEVAELEIAVVGDIVNDNIKYPTLLAEAVIMEDEVGRKIATVTRYAYFTLAGETGITMATQENRMEFVNTMIKYLTEIRFILYNFREHAYWVRLMGAPKGLDYIKSLVESYKKVNEKLLKDEESLIRSFFAKKEED